MNCVEVSLQVEEGKRTATSTAAQVTGRKEIQQSKTWDGSVNLMTFPIKN